MTFVYFKYAEKNTRRVVDRLKLINEENYTYRWQQKTQSVAAHLSVEHVGVLPSFDDLLYISIDRSSVLPFTINEVNSCDYRLSSWSSSMDFFHSSLVIHCSTVCVVTRQVYQEVGMVPRLHTVVTASPAFPYMEVKVKVQRFV